MQEATPDKKILIVEDEPAIAENISYALETDGFDVVWCSTGREAREHMAEDGIALVVLDVGLPDGNGFDLCREIRKTSRVPIIFLTARTDEIDRVVGLEIGGDDYVTKPFSPRELTARVKAVLRRFPEVSPPANAGLPFSVDKHRLSIAYYGEPLDLSRYEFRILEVLVSRPGWVFSREQLMNRVWEEPESSLDRTVDTHIKTLRAKLRKARPGVEPRRKCWQRSTQRSPGSVSGSDSPAPERDSSASASVA
jgi:two-component system catabolic regulation response regulator CreB